MAVDGWVGTFAKAIGGAPVDQAVSDVNITATPQLLILRCTGQTAFGAFSADYIFCLGAATGTLAADMWSAAAASQDAQATSNCNGRSARKAITIIDNVGTLVAEADLKSFDASGFTLTWTTNNGIAIQIEYLVAWGFDSVKLKEFVASTAGGDQAVAGVGFQPDAMPLFMTVADGIAPPNNIGAANIAFGCQKTANVRDSCGWVAGVSLDNNATARAENRYTGDTTVDGSIGAMKMKGGIGSLNGGGLIKSYDADGVTITWLATPDGAWYGAMLLTKGGEAHVERRTTPAATGTEAVASPGFKVNLAMFLTPGSISVNDNAPGHGWASGAGVESCAHAADNDGVETMETDRLLKNDKALAICQAGTPSIVAEADIDSFDGSGYTWNWTTTVSGKRYAHFVYGEVPRSLVMGRRSIGHYIGR